MLHPDPPSIDEPVTTWLRRLEDGQLEAAQPLWDHFCRKLLNLASNRLSPKLKRTYDEEDAAQSAFHSLCRVIADGRHSDLSSRENLWRLLVTITERKIMARIKHETRDKRDIRRSLSESGMFQTGSEAIGLNALPSHEPTPEFAAEFADICNAMVDGLHDESLKQVAQLRLTDHNNAEIAELLGMTRRTVERKLLLIKARWESMAAEVQAG